ncbi:MAG: hypothetical protein JNL51_09920 [Chitinophagaceae bacterium]|nr:hypothetical protein [Chitinophagaceae bacterium]
MLRFIISVILIYGLVRLVFNFIIPLFRATQQMRSQVKEFQDRMNTQYQNPYQSANQAASSAQAQKKSDSHHSEDYIEFEEIKNN